MKIRKLRRIRHKRIRKKISGTKDKPRLCVFRSNKHIYAQIIDDTSHHTLASVSTLCKEFKTMIKDRTSDNSGDKPLKNSLSQDSKTHLNDTAYLIGKLIAERAKKIGISQVCFDRGGYKYHGKVKNLSNGCREGGLIF